MKKYFETIEDPRQQAKVMHNFAETIMIVVCAVIAGCDVWEDIEDYCRVKQRWFRERIGLKLENGIPSHDTMSRIFGMMDPKEFQARFIEWAQEAGGKHAREILSVDGKTMRGSRDGDVKPVHMVSAWASKARAVFGQLAVEEKSNEITAVPMQAGLRWATSCSPMLPRSNRVETTRQRDKEQKRIGTKEEA